MACIFATSYGRAVEPSGSINTVDLRCEYQREPLAIDSERPRLSWRLESGRRGVSQSAYRVLVSTSEETLQGNRGDIWDSGKVESDQSLHIRYAGRALETGRRYEWKVRVWDEQGRASAWSEASWWQMGLLRDTDWHAKWISRSDQHLTNVKDAAWIWFPEGDPSQAVPPATRFFRKTFVLPANRRIRSAYALIAADNSFVLHANGRKLGEGVGWESLQRIDLTAALQDGENVIGVSVTNSSTVPNPAGWIGKVVAEFEDRATIVFETDVNWRVSKLEEPGWSTAAFDDSNWPLAMRIGPADTPPWHAPTAATKPLPIFRHEFDVRAPIRRATAYVCGLGFYELRINGQKVGRRLFDPGWTNYRKTCLYATYDVTSALRQGANAMGVMLGNGMYNVTGGRYVKFTGSFGDPKFILQLQIEHQDGTSSQIVSDDTWRNDEGPIRFSCIFGGEDYDARLEHPGWDETGFDDATWERSTVCEGPGGRLLSQYSPPIEVIDSLSPVAVSEPSKGTLVYDLGQNFSGIPSIEVRGQAGSTVRMTPGELLGDDGLVTQSASGGPHYYSYTLKGEGEEQWQPRFTYYGFRYLQIEGASREPGAGEGTPVLLDVAGRFTRNSASRNGSFSCSNQLLNRIHDLIDWSIGSNLQSVLTDCPHREKLGWLEVAHLMAPSIMMRYDVPLFYRKVARDIRESQLENGLVPDIAPEYVVFGGGFRDSPEWGSACVIIPWLMYEWYGDTDVLEESYTSMKRYVEYLTDSSENLIVSHGLGDWCDFERGGGVGESALTPKSLTATAIYYRDIEIVSKTAQLLGYLEEAKTYSALAANVRAAFTNELFNSGSNTYATGSQTANAMPLALGLVDAERRDAVFASLTSEVENRNYITAGDVGFYFLLQVLADGGRNDLVYQLVNRTDSPGYGYQLDQGATSLTEAWDGRRVVSHNHCMLGHVFGWFYQDLAGIKRDASAAGFKKIRIEPSLVGDLTWAEASYGSLYGTIESSWRIQNEEIVMRVTVPGNTTAEIRIPRAVPEDVLGNGGPASRAVGVRSVRAEDGAVVCEVGSGRYEFVAPIEESRER